MITVEFKKIQGRRMYFTITNVGDAVKAKIQKRIPAQFNGTLEDFVEATRVNLLLLFAGGVDEMPYAPGVDHVGANEHICHSGTVKLVPRANNRDIADEYASLVTKLGIV